MQPAGSQLPTFEVAIATQIMARPRKLPNPRTRRFNVGATLLSKLFKILME